MMSEESKIQSISNRIECLECSKKQFVQELNITQTEITENQKSFDSKKHLFTDDPYQVLSKLQENELRVLQKHKHLESRLRHLQSLLTKNDNTHQRDGDFGFLISLFELKPEAQSYSTHYILRNSTSHVVLRFLFMLFFEVLALNIIAENYLKIRVVENTQIAHKILDEQLQNYENNKLSSTLRFLSLF
jgi:hypothetical protein